VDTLMEDTLTDVAASTDGTPATGKAWSKLTTTKIQRGKAQSSDILTRLQRLDCEEAAAKGAALEQANREAERVKMLAKGRIRKHQVIINDSQSCILAIQESMQRLADVLSRTRHERYKRFADSQVNDRRQELRDKRPAPEAWKDPLQTNLFREKSMLANARKELMECESEVSKFLEELEKLRAALSYDTGARRLKVEHEMHLLKPKVEDPSAPAASKKDAPVCLEATDEPAAADAATTSAETATVAADMETTAETAAAAKSSNHAALPELPLDGAEARQHVTKTTAMLGRVENFIQKSMDAIRRSNTEGFDATRAVEKSLSKRTVQLNDMKKELEENILNVRYAITEGKKGVEKFNKRLDPRDTEKAAKIENAQKVLDNLCKSEAALVDDLRTKTKALVLDNSCRRVTPTVAAEKRTMPTKDKTMKQSNSSPTIGGSVGGESPVDGERTMSPFGGSSALKAGAALAVSAG
jgi:hypothetical protein